MASSSVVVWSRFATRSDRVRHPSLSMDSCTLPPPGARRATRPDGRYSRTRELCRVHVHDGEGSLAAGRLDRKVQEHRRVFAALNSRRSLALRRHLSQDEDGVGLEKVEVRHQVRRSVGVGVTSSRLWSWGSDQAGNTVLGQRVRCSRPGNLTSLVMYDRAYTSNGCRLIACRSSRPRGPARSEKGGHGRYQHVVPRKAFLGARRGQPLARDAPPGTIIAWRTSDSRRPVLACSFQDIVLVDLAVASTRHRGDLPRHRGALPETLEFVDRVSARYGLNLT